MRKTRVILAFLVVVFAAVTALICLRQSSLYSRQSVLQWAVRASRGDVSAEAALRKAGSGAVPQLMDLVCYRNSRLEISLMALRGNLPGFLKAPADKLIGEAPGEVRTAAVRALGRLGPAAAEGVPVLLEVLNNDAMMRSEAAKSLARIGLPALPGLRRAAQCSDMDVCRSAAFSLGQLGPVAAPAVPELIRIVEQGNDEARASAAYALSCVGPEGVSVLRGMLDVSNTNKVTQMAAKRAVVGNPAAFYPKSSQ